MAALRSVLHKPQQQDIEQLYRLLCHASPLNYLDVLLPAVAQDPQLPANKLQALAEWLATESPDRNAVKVAIALLGFSQRRKVVRYSVHWGHMTSLRFMRQCTEIHTARG